MFFGAVPASDHLRFASGLRALPRAASVELFADPVTFGQAWSAFTVGRNGYTLSRNRPPRANSNRGSAQAKTFDRFSWYQPSASRLPSGMSALKKISGEVTPRRFNTSRSRSRHLVGDHAAGSPRRHTEKRASANGMVRPCSCPASD